MKRVKKKTSSKNDFLSKLPWVVWSVTLLSVLFFAQENLLRAITVLAFALHWAWLARKKGEFKASVLSLLLVLPLNITIAFPSLVDPYIAGIYVNYLVPVVSILDIFTLLLLCSLIGQKKSFSDFINRTPKIYFIALIYLIIHTLLHPQLNVVVNSFRLAAYGLTFWLAIGEIRKLSRTDFINDLMIVFLIAVLSQTVLGMGQFLLGRSIGLEFLGESRLLSGAIGTSSIELSAGEFLRAYGTFPHPNVLAGFLLFAFLISGFAYLKQRKNLPLIVAVLTSFLLVFTFSRVAILLWLFSVIAISLYSLRDKVFSVLIFERFTNFFNGKDYSWEDRATLMNESIRVIKQNSVTGVGSGNFTKQLEANVPYTAGGISLLQPVHNVFLLLIAEHGLVGGLLILVVTAVGKVKHILSSQGTLRTFRIIGIVAVITIGMFDHYLLTLPQGLSILLISLFL